MSKRSKNFRANTPRRVRDLVSKDSPELAAVIERNMQSIEAHRQESERLRTFQDRIADAITYFTGSMPFVYVHVVLFTAWIMVNVGLFHIPAFDPYPFGMLTTIVSLEAIFLSTFVLVSQNRQAHIADRRTELDLHINLLSEYEITRLLKLTHEMVKHLNIHIKAEDLAELEKDVRPEVLLKELENRAQEGNT